MVVDNIGSAEILDDSTDLGISSDKKVSKGKAMIFIIAIVVLAALGAGGLYVSQIMEASAPEYEAIEVVYNFPGNTTNVSGYEDIYLRFAYSLVFEVNESTKGSEYNDKITYVNENLHLIKSATIAAAREMTRRELTDPDAPLELCDSILENVNELFESIKPQVDDYGIRSGFGALIGKDTNATIEKRGMYERLSNPKEIQFTKCYYTDFIIQ